MERTYPLKKTFDLAVDFHIDDENIDDDMDNFILGYKAKNTVYKDTSGCKRLQLFMKERNPNETRNFYELEKDELDELMCRFFMKATKIDRKSIEKEGELYQPDTLSAFRNAWQRVIEEKKLKFNIKTDPEFERSRKVLSSKRKQLTRLGMGNKPNAARPLEENEIETLWDKKYFGLGSPTVLQRTVWWILTTSFGYRARDESVKILFGDIKLCVDHEGVQYLEWDKERH